ncbi:MAG: aspartate carbamoyltransferase regulatory subunit [Bacilli bacterium]|nr:aspartate carbamoyltransferase regulatory subunit [Bacilli bacterium]MDD4795388.1 aspartate carbamoyltransferase regulatory subunit [Bacilli bacterium]
MLRVTSIAKGIVIDHIPAGEGIKIFNFLELDKVSYRVALLMNVPSKKMKCKDIIKIENEININLDILSVLNKDITINVIKDEKIIKKYNPKIPQEIESVIKCKNPRCVTSVETKLKNKYILISEESKEYRCQYCEEVIKLTSL